MEEKEKENILNDPMLNKNSSFHGNLSLKGQYEEEALTKEHLQELKKCSENPIYFAENYINIINIDTGKQLIKLFPYQKKILDTYQNNRYSICLSCRQSGKCVTKDTIITVKNKDYNNGEPFEIEIGKLFDICSSK